MFTKVFTTISVLVALSAHVNGHTLMTPALGVQGAGARSDVQVLALSGGCGRMNVAENIDSSTPVAAAADGTFTVTATNFNRLRDGSRELTAKMDSTGTGNNFNTAVTVSQNGDPRPKTLGSDQIVAKLPAGTTCSGGASGNLCLVSFENGAIQRFGNCVVVSQNAAAGSATAATGSAATAAGTGATAAGASTGSNATEGGAATGAVTGASDTSAVGASTGSNTTESGAGTGVSAGTAAGTGVNGAASGAGASTESTATEGGAGAATGSTATGAVTGASDTGVSAGTTASGASDNSAVGASTGSTATEGGAGTGVSAGTTAGTGVGAGVNGAVSGAGVATSGSTTASTRRALSQGGTRAARDLLSELQSLADELPAEDPLDLVRRGIADWIWA